MPSKLKGKWTLKQLLIITYRYYSTRYKYMYRDVIKSAIKVQKVLVYDKKNIGQARTKFVIKSSSYPQYKPYYTGFDKRGRKIKYQRTYKHTYDIIIQLEELSMDVPIKIRTGSNKKYNFNPPKNLIKSKNNPYGKYLSIGDYNINVLKLNPDHFFTNEYIRYIEGCLFGKCYAKGMPTRKTNKFGLPFLTKHEIWVVKTLMNWKILK